METTSSKNKRIAKNTLLLYFRMLFMMGVSLYTSRIILQNLGIEDFGIYNVVAGFVTMFTFLNGAMSTATQRYLNYEMGQNQTQKLYAVFSTSIQIHAFISLIVLVLAETIGLWFLYNHLIIPSSRFEAALWVYQSAILSTIVLIMSVPYNAAIIAHEKMSAFAYISVLEVILKLAIVYILAFTGYDKLKLYALLMLLIQVIIRIIYGSYCKRHFPETTYHHQWNKPLFREMCHFAGWNLFGNIAALAFTQGVNILLNIFFGPAVNAARGIAVQVQNAVKNFCINFQTALNPQITKSYAQNDIQYMHQLIYTSSRFSVYLLMYLSIPILIETDQILYWWLKIVPQDTNIFLRLILIISVIEGLANPLIQGAMANGRIKAYQAVVGTLLILIVPVSYIAIRMGAPAEGVFYVHLAIAILSHAVRLRMIAPLIQMHMREYVRKVIVPIVPVCLIGYLLPLLLSMNMPPTLLRFIAVTVVSTVALTTAIATIGSNNAEKQFVYNKIKSILHRS